MSHSRNRFFSSLQNPFAPIRKQREVVAEDSPSEKINEESTNNYDQTQYNPDYVRLR